MAEDTPSVNEYEDIVIDGVKCIKTVFVENNLTSRKETARRKAVKDDIGLANKDTIILDSKSGKRGQSEYCNAIVYASNTDRWINGYSQKYASDGYKLKNKAVNGGTQHTWRNANSKTVITMTCYEAQSKIMVQPGLSGERDLLRWVADSRSAVNHHAPLLFPPLSDASDSDIVKTVPKTTEDTTNVGESSEAFIPAEQLRVRIPVEISADAQGTSSPTTYSSNNNALDSSLLSEKSPPLIHNELLCFLKQQLNNIPVDTLVKLCSDFYKDEEIAAAKKLLFESVDTQGRRHNKRVKGPEQGRENMHDIIRVMLEIKLSDMPIFYAVNLSNTPPTSYNNVDILKLLQEIESMKTNLTMLTSGHQELAAGQRQVVNLLQQQKASDSETLSTTTTKLPLPTPVEPSSTSSDDAQWSSSDDDQGTNNDYEELSDFSEEDESTKRSYAALLKDIDTVNRFAPLAPKEELKSAPPVRSRVIVNSMSKSTAPDRKGQAQKVNSRTSSGTPKDCLIGTGSFPSLHASKPNGGSIGHNNQSGHKSCLGVFVTRLDPKTSEAQINRHVLQELSLRIRAERLDTKYNSYSSFFIRCDGKVRRQLLDADRWPQKVLVKPYFA